MGRPPRAAEGGLIYHALNRANARLTIFEHPDDYDAFLRVPRPSPLTLFRPAPRLLPHAQPLPPPPPAPEADGGLSRFMRRVTLTQTQRWHAHRHSAGSGHLYQGRFKSFPIQDDDHLLVACRYVERNALRAGLVARAEDWRWGSLARLAAGPAAPATPPLTPWPIPRPDDWLALVNAPMTPAEEEALARCIRRGRPFGGPDWQAEAIARLGLESTTRPPADPASRLRADETS